MLATLTGCPKKTAIWVLEGSTADDLTFGLGKDSGRIDGGVVKGIAVLPCGQAPENTPEFWWRIFADPSKRRVASPGTVRYGVVPEDWIEYTKAKGLVAGDYEVFTDGTGSVFLSVDGAGNIGTVDVDVCSGAQQSAQVRTGSLGVLAWRAPDTLVLRRLVPERLSECGLHEWSMAGAVRPRITGEAVCEVLAAGRTELSPDGRSLLYGGTLWSAEAIQVGIFDVETSTTTVLADTCLPATVAPAWSADGERIAFGADCNEPHDAAVLHLAKPDGSGMRSLGAPPDSAFEGSPSWSPDGRIAYMREYFVHDYLGVDAHPPRGIAIADTATGARRFLVAGSIPSWSPTGEWIAYAPPVEEGSVIRSSVALIRPDGSDDHVLFVSDDRGTYAYPGGHQIAMGSPTWPFVWSPDGMRLAFTRVYPDGDEIWSIAVDGTDLRCLTERGGKQP